MKCAIYGVAAAPFRILAEIFFVALPWHLVVINAQSIVEANYLLEHRRADESSRIPSLFLKNSRQWPRCGGQNESAGIANVMNRRILAGENTCVRRRCQWRLCDGIFKKDTALREFIQVRRFNVRVTVAM